MSSPFESYACLGANELDSHNIPNEAKASLDHVAFIPPLMKMKISAIILAAISLLASETLAHEVSYNSFL